jgi:DNA-binding beta-propeller fold protein YncE
MATALFGMAAAGVSLQGRPGGDMTMTGRWWRAVLVLLAACAVAPQAEAQPYVYALARARYPDIISQRLLVLDTRTNTIVGGVNLGRTQGIRPEHLAVAPDGARVYAINSLDFSVSVVSTQSGAVVDTWPDTLIPNPGGVAVSADSQRVYVTGTEARAVGSPFEAALFVIDAATRSLRARIPLESKFAYGIALSPDGLTAYILTSTDGASAVAVIDITTESLVKTVPLPGSRAYFFQPTLSPGGRYLYFTRYNESGEPSSVQVLDVVSNTIVATTTVGVGTAAVAVSPDGNTVYVSGGGGEVHRLNAVTHDSDGAFALPAPSRAAFLPDSSRAYIAGGYWRDSIYVVDTATQAVTGTIAVPVNQAGGTVYGGVGALAAAPPAAVEPGSTPTNLRAAGIVGNRVTLQWSAPSRVSATGYVLEGGLTPGQVVASIPTGSPATAITLDVPSGTFYVRVRALSSAGPTAPSNEIRIAVNLPTAPSAPGALLGLADGTNLGLSWTNAPSGGTPTSMVLDVGGAITASLPLPVSETFSFTGVPPGTYTFTVRAVNAAGASAASSPVTLAFPSTCPGPPQAPTNFAVIRQGAQLTASWDPPTAGPAVASYVLRVTGAASLALPMSTRSISGVVSPGTYTLAVQAVNTCGGGADTAPQTVTVP